MSESDYKVAEQYAPIVVATGEVAIAYVHAAPTAKRARRELLADALTFDGLGGTFRFNAHGKCRWEGATLAGALTAEAGYRRRGTRRIWHTDESGTRRLVLTHTQ